MTTRTEDLTAQGATLAFSLQPGETAKFSTSGTFTGYAFFERSRNNGASWETIQDAAVDTNLAGGTRKNESPADERYRFRIADTDAVTPVTGTLSTKIWSKQGISRSIAGRGKIGATAGWVVAGADDLSLNTCPASKTAATVTLALPGLNKGDIIVGFHLVGQIESAGGTVTVDAALHKHVAAAADVTDTALGSITQLSVTADTVMGEDNTRVDGLRVLVSEHETFFLLITATTDAATDIALMGVQLEIIPAPLQA